MPGRLRHTLTAAFLLTVMFTLVTATSSVSHAQDRPDQDTTPDDTISGIAPGEAAGDGEPLSVLFIGNSYTASAGAQTNLVAALMRLRGKDVAVQSYIRGGETLEGFWLRNAGDELTYWERRALARQTDDAAREAYLTKLREDRRKTIGALDSLLDKGPYDVVVLQSWTGARMPEEDLGFQKYAGLLAERIRRSSPDARLVLYMTWSSQNGREQQRLISDNCYQAAQANNMIVAPAGEAAWEARDKRDDLLLYRSDKDSHPGHDGAYLIACTLYAAITGESPVGLPHELMIPRSYDFPVGIKDPDREAKVKALGSTEEFAWKIDAEKAALLQNVAWTTYQQALTRTEMKNHE